MRAQFEHSAELQALSVCMNAVCKLSTNSRISKEKLVRLAGIEPTTLGFGGQSAYLGELRCCCNSLILQNIATGNKRQLTAAMGRKYL
jgi:hypothetical protein